MTARRIAGAALAAGVAAALAAGIAGGLLRAGVPLPASELLLPRAAVAHAALMIGAFFGTVIGIERAVAARFGAAWSAPVASAVAGAAFMAGFDAFAAWLLVASSAAFLAVNVLLFRRQRAPHTLLLVASAVASFAGNLMFAMQWAAAAVVPAWLAFLIVTIAAERLEMTRLMRRRPGAQPALFVILAALAAGVALSAFHPSAGNALWGLAAFALAVWLLAFDIARRTVRAAGLPRYMAVCLLTGYAWLGIGGAAWMAMAAGAPVRDAALHAIGLGFVFSMVMGHAPVILPAVARVKLRFGPVFYAPVVLLHASLAWRLSAALAQGAVANASAIVLFALTVAGAALAWRAHESRQIS